MSARSESAGASTAPPSSVPSPSRCDLIFAADLFDEVEDDGRLAAAQEAGQNGHCRNERSSSGAERRDRNQHAAEVAAANQRRTRPATQSMRRSAVHLLSVHGGAVQCSAFACTATLTLREWSLGGAIAVGGLRHGWRKGAAEAAMQMDQTACDCAKLF